MRKNGVERGIRNNEKERSRTRTRKREDGFYRLQNGQGSGDAEPMRRSLVNRICKTHSVMSC